jgi:catechol 2,3-dioxygenase-like lactoylglutathione lyase family enzyme
MRLIVLLALLCTPVLAAAQQGPGREDRAITAVAGTFFALSVADLDAAEAWYAEKLGLKAVARGGPQGRLGGFVVLEGHGWTVELIRHQDSTRPSVASRELVQGITKVGAMVADFDAAVALLRARGVTIVAGPFPPRQAARANMVFRDSSGNLIQLLGDYART